MLPNDDRMAYSADSDLSWIFDVCFQKVYIVLLNEFITYQVPSTQKTKDVELQRTSNLYVKVLIGA